MTGLFGFVLSILLIPGISGAGTTPRWALAAVIIPLLLKPTKLTAAHVFGLIFIWYAAISVTWSHPYDGLNGLFQLMVAAEAFWLGSQLKNIRPILIGFGLGVWISSFVMLFHVDVPHATDYAGLLVNANIMGELAGLVLVGVVTYRLWWLVPGIIPAFWIAHSRGAFAAVGAVGISWIWGRSKLAAIALSIIGLAGLVYASNSPSAQDRLSIWSSALPHLSLMGHGLGSFYTLFPLYLPGVDSLNIRHDHLHNDWLEIVFETGVFGAILAAAFVGACWARARQTSQAIMLAFAVEACFGFPMHSPATLVFGCIGAGYAVRGGVSLRELRDTWRNVLQCWYEESDRVSARREVVPTRF